VEVGYSIDPKERRKGHAKAALRILLDVARMDGRVKTVAASVGPDNLGSKGLVEKEGLGRWGSNGMRSMGWRLCLRFLLKGEKCPYNTFGYMTLTDPRAISR